MAIFVNAKLKSTLFEDKHLCPASAICYVEYKNHFGTGAIFGWKSPQETMKTLFITSFDLLTIQNVEEVTGLTLIFDDKTIGKFDVTPDWVKLLWTSPHDKLSVTVIELSPTALKVLSRTKVIRLIPANQIENENVTFFYYSYNAVDRYSALNYGMGDIYKIEGDTIYLNIESKEEVSSIGFPILNKNKNVVAIHVGIFDTTNPSGKISLKTINIQSILKFFNDESVKKSANQTENEMWLQRIKQIPENEFHLIGIGGYGKVFKIKDCTAKNNNDFAIKVVDGFGGLQLYRTQVLALEKEYRLVTQLDIHPRIIQFFALVRDDNKARIMIIMEYLPSGSLADKLLEHKPLADKAVLKYLVQILEGVEFLHQNKIYHSDIKPANILFNEDDNLKICDFGIAVHCQTESSANSSHLKGDYYYMSPERHNGASRSAANDIWGIGATFVEMITGRPLNYQENQVPSNVIMNISKYNLFINNGIPLKDFLAAQDENSFKKKIISRTLCGKDNRANFQELLSISKTYLIDIIT